MFIRHKTQSPSSTATVQTATVLPVLLTSDLSPALVSSSCHTRIMQTGSLCSVQYESDSRLWGNHEAGRGGGMGGYVSVHTLSLLDGWQHATREAQGDTDGDEVARTHPGHDKTVSIQTVDRCRGTPAPHQSTPALGKWWSQAVPSSQLILALAGCAGSYHLDT
jgi:hypothetical protein